MKLNRTCRKNNQTLVMSENDHCVKEPQNPEFTGKSVFSVGRQKYLPRSHTRKTLTQAVQLRADETLRKLAVERGDEKIIAVTSRDIVAAEAHYHVSCYKNFTSTKGYRPSSTNEKTDNEDTLYQKAEEEAYSELWHYVKDDLVCNQAIVPLAALLDKLRRSILSRGINSVKDSTRTHFRRKLEARFPEELHIFPDSRGKLLVMPQSLDAKELACRCQSLKVELALWKSKTATVTDVLDKASLHLRGVVKEAQQSTPWPLHPTDFENMPACGPSDLERFFLSLLSGDPDNTAPSARIKTLVDSFSQDVIYAVTRGQQKPPKHYLLAYGIKTTHQNGEQTWPWSILRYS